MIFIKEERRLSSVSHRNHTVYGQLSDLSSTFPSSYRREGKVGGLKVYVKTFGRPILSGRPVVTDVFSPI